MSCPVYEIVNGGGPMVSVALHDGHEVRDEVAPLLAVSEADRLREEDPYTGLLAKVTDSYIILNRSRFEVDMNRPREKAVYMEPEDAWGLEVWKRKPPARLVEESLAEYDAFYASVRQFFSELQGRYGSFAVFDIHSYNHRREGPGCAPASHENNPEIDIGTSGMNMQKWGSLLDRFVSDLRGYNFMGRNLDVRVNVLFDVSHFSRWVHENFPQSGVSLSVEFKKFFMDEWEGTKDEACLEALAGALRSTIPGIMEELNRIR